MQGFGAQTTADEVLDGVDLTGKRVFITGVSAGIGVETARALASRGAKVVGGVRNFAKAREATAHIPADQLSLVELDLAALASVRACADRLVAAGDPFDIVIANAGVLALDTPTAEGFEAHFGINHLGHFVLVNRLVPLLRAGSRVAVLSSLGHHFADVDLDDPNFERHAANPVEAYGASKTANALFAVAFDARHRGRGIRATAVNPGDIMTEVARYMQPEHWGQMKQAIIAAAGEEAMAALSWKTVEQGAATSVWAAVRAGADDIGGHFCSDCRVAERNETGIGWHGYRGYALDPERAEQLWAVSVALVGERFSSPQPAAP